MRKSSRHVEVNLSDLHGYEKHVLVALMNEPHAAIEKHGECDHITCRGTFDFYIVELLNY